MGQRGGGQERDRTHDMALLTALIAGLRLRLCGAVLGNVPLEAAVVAEARYQRWPGTQEFEDDLPSRGTGLRTVSGLVAD